LLTSESFPQISPIAADILRQHFLKSAEATGQAPTDKELLLKKIVNKSLSIPAVETYNSQNLVHPRDMNLEQLECHLLELQAKDMNPRGVLRRLLTLNCREGKLERAKEVKAMCDQLNVDLSPGMMANIFDLYVRTKDTAKATETLDEVRARFPGFLVDEHKIIDYAALLVEEQQFDQAKAALKKHASQRTVKGGEKILKNLWKLLKNVSVASAAAKAPENLTSTFFKLLVQLGYCDARNNTLLGPVIREHLLKGELRLAVERYKEFCTKYRKTPLQMELYTALIGVSNNNYAGQSDLTAEEAKTQLNDCVAASSAIHGPENTHIHLVIALAEVGTANQLRKLLIDPAVRISFNTLLKQCEHLSEMGKIEPVLRLAKSSRGLGNINEQELYNTILNHFVRVNDCDAAIGLYERILDDDFKLSATFMGNLVDLLAKNNLAVPTSVAIYAKRENL
jgi:leucine-rich PPR motif-containing protein, mitochondrial